MQYSPNLFDCITPLSLQAQGPMEDGTGNANLNEGPPALLVSFLLISFHL